jgi:hypothetical protein
MQGDIHWDARFEPSLPGNAIHHPQPWGPALVGTPEPQRASNQVRLTLPRKLEWQLRDPHSQHRTNPTHTIGGIQT